MYYSDLSVLGIILWVIFGFIAILPWIIIVVITLQKFLQFLRLPRAKAIEMKQQ
jgi:hypothetical protein